MHGCNICSEWSFKHKWSLVRNHMISSPPTDVHAHVSIEYINYIIVDVDNAGQIADMVHHVTTLNMGF